MVDLAVLGDSSAVGVGVSHQRMGLAHGIAHALAMESGRGVRWQVMGRTGATMSATRRELAVQLRMPIDVVVIALGANVVVWLTGERRWTEGARALAQNLHDAGVEAVVFSSVPPVGRFAALPQPARRILGIRARLLDALLRETLVGLDGACYCEIEFPSGRQYMASDGFHPSEAGYYQWSQ
ncbi:MAG TPA: SGNH/GDSL hydrolase family protein [Kofleriaceae bacterium]|jgi:lysophospholipase L1-like esterase|nr:SGNH/GDSL hydrolase family protein [Kofleriaceae bacterium]